MYQTSVFFAILSSVYFFISFVLLLVFPTSFVIRFYFYFWFTIFTTLHFIFTFFVEIYSKFYLAIYIAITHDLLFYNFLQLLILTSPFLINFLLNIAFVFFAIVSSVFSTFLFDFTRDLLLIPNFSNSSFQIHVFIQCCWWY